MENLFARLDADWHDTARRPVSTDTLRAWAERDATLASFSTLDDLVAHVQRRGHPEDSDRVLALLARHASEDHLAARTLLQCLLPGLGAVAARHRWARDHLDLDALI